MKKCNKSCSSGFTHKKITNTAKVNSVTAENNFWELRWWKMSGVLSPFKRICNVFDSLRLATCFNEKESCFKK